jgi:hypothetical protein
MLSWLGRKWWDYRIMDFLGPFLLAASVVAPIVYAVIQTVLSEWIKRQIVSNAENRAALDALMGELLDIAEHYYYVEIETIDPSDGLQRAKLLMKKYGSLRYIAGDSAKYSFLPVGTLTFLMQLEKRVRNTDLVIEELLADKASGKDQLAISSKYLKKRAEYVQSCANHVIDYLMKNSCSTQRLYAQIVQERRATFHA